MKFLVILFFLSSCSNLGTVFKTYTVSRDITESTKLICLSGEGKGRLSLKNRKYSFGFESGVNKEEEKWILGLNFPLRKMETFELDWSDGKKVKFKTSIEDKLLRENRNLNPKSLSKFTHGLGKLIEEVLLIRDVQSDVAKQKTKFIWESTDNYLMVSSKDKKFTAKFSDIILNKYFQDTEITYEDSKGYSYKMELKVRNCFESDEANLN